jgi:hypothetical protein
MYRQRNIFSPPLPPLHSGGGAGDQARVGLPNFLRRIKTIKYALGTYTGRVDSTGLPKGQGTYTSSYLPGVTFKSSSWHGSKVHTTVKYDENQTYQGDLRILPSGDFEKDGFGVYTYNTNPLQVQDKKIKRIECKWIEDEIDIKNSVIITYDDEDTYIGYIHHDYTPVVLKKKEVEDTFKMEEITHYFDDRIYLIDPLSPYQLSTRILLLPDTKKRDILVFLANKFIKEPSNSGLPVLVEHLQASVIFKELFHAINVCLLIRRRGSVGDIKSSYLQIKSDVLQSVIKSEFRNVVISTPDMEIRQLGIIYDNYAAIADPEKDTALLASIVRKVHSYAAAPIKKMGDLKKTQVIYTEKFTSAAKLEKINQEIVTNQETIDTLLAPIEGQQLGIAVKKNNYATG